MAAVVGSVTQKVSTLCYSATDLHLADMIPWQVNWLQSLASFDASMPFHALMDNAHIIVRLPAAILKTPLLVTMRPRTLRVADVSN